MKIAKKKYIFKDACAPHVGTYKCAEILRRILIEDESPIRVYYYTTPNPGFDRNYRKNSIYEIDKDFNIVFKDLKTKLLQRKVHPNQDEGFGLYYVYTYDEVPTENQLRNSHLVYVCCEDVEVEDEINKGTIILPSGKPKFVNWYSKNKGSGTHLLGTFRAVVSKDNKYFKKIKEHGFTHPNRIKKEIKPQIFGLNKKENDVEHKND